MKQTSRKPLDLTGHKFNYLTVISSAGKDKRGESLWNCLCKCGKTIIVLAKSLKSGNTGSCGCLHKEGLIKRSTTHNLRRHPLYSVWCGIKSRCYNPNAINYETYGAKGVSVCAEWKEDFKSFYDWAIANGWQKGLEIDKDIIGDGLLYSPETCCFVTSKQNCNEKTNNRVVVYNQESFTVSELADRFKIRFHTLQARLDRGWSVKDAVEKPLIGRSVFPEIKHAFGFIN